MSNVNKERVELSIKNLREKKSRIYLFVQDTKGNARASVRYIYELAMTLKKSNFNPIMLHEKNDYVGVAGWLGKDYMEIPHQSIENQNLEITPEDFLVVPEIFGYVMDQVKKLPCAKIVLVQSYAFITETLQPGQSWSQFGFYKCITTTSKQKEYIEKVMRQSSIDILEPTISEVFNKKSVPPLPIIGVHTKEQEDAVNLIKTFYLKFPQFRWFTFRDMRGLNEKDFANSLKDCCLSVWIDNKSGFGTFPLESMACNVPCLGKVPDLQPSWMNEDNGIWVTDVTLMTDFIADYIQNWLEDNIKPELYTNMDKTAQNFKDKQKFETEVVQLFNSYLQTRADSFEEQLSKFND
jgi:glycosyltransferase involved in cell wall biosynthesis